MLCRLLFTLSSLRRRRRDALPVRDRVDRPRDVLDVPVVQPREADPAVPRKEDRVLPRQCVAHVGRHAREGEHPDLLRHVTPIVNAPHLPQRFDQSYPHGAYAVRHLPAVVVVLSRERRVREDGAHDVRSVYGRAGVHGTRDQPQLAQHRGPLGGVRAHDAHGPGPLAVQAEILREALREDDVVPPLDERAQRGRVGLGVPRREPLVGRIEERHVPLVRDDVGYRVPLLRGRVAPRGVVGARVQQYHAAVGRVSQVLDEPVVIEPVRGVVVVPVAPHVHAALAEDGGVVPPRGGRDVYGHPGLARGLRDELREEVPPHAARPGAAQGLDARDDG